jgi:hypothetical protein
MLAMYKYVLHAQSQAGRKGNSKGVVRKKPVVHMQLHAPLH